MDETEIDTMIIEAANDLIRGRETPLTRRVKLFVSLGLKTEKVFGMKMEEKPRPMVVKRLRLIKNGNN